MSEKLDLKLLDNAKKIEVNYDKKLLKQIEALKKENQKLKAKAKKYDEIVNLRTTPNALENCLAEYMNKCMAFENKNKKLKKQNKILSHNSTNIVMTDTKVMKRNLELQTENQELKEVNRYYKDKYLDLYNSYQNCEDLKRKRAIEIIKSKKVDMRYFLEYVDLDTYNFWATKEDSETLTQQEYDLLNEVFGE